MSMKLQFDPNQEYQLDAVKSVVDLFEGQQTTSGANLFDVSAIGMFRNEQGMGNLLHITQENLVENLRKTQERNHIEAAGEYGGNHFSVEMETGTGKTYVYLRTIFELHKTYGFSKFVIVVPSVAIREGVLKSLDITKEHFRTLYGNPEYQYFVYDSKKPTMLRQFATANQLSVMVINIDAFNTKDNVINRPNDKVGGVPIEFVQQTQPFVIMDEPQNMESEIAQKAIESLNPLCTLRYSATHRNLYNQIYRLSPVDAYDMGLVKRIEVASVAEEGSQNDAYIKLKEIKAGKRSIVAKLEIERAEKGEVKRKVIAVSTSGNTADLYAESGGMPAYEGYVVSSIDARDEIIEFANGKSVSMDDSTGEMKDAIMRQQIEETIKEHFHKMLRLKKHDIKVLSLFFIDAVVNYRDHENGTGGKLAVWFEEVYEQYRNNPKFKELNMPEAAAVHDGYFSKDKKGNIKDTKGNTKDDGDTYELIMKDKERLLSMDEPLQFIFSHSALREGWDSPNVFQICTLNESDSYVKKRQEIGRGLRLAVNQSGERVFDSSVNLLTVIANESYDTFARSLQDEIERETGIEFGKNRIKNRRKRKSAKLKKNWNVDPAFETLWKKINKKTRYNVAIDIDIFVSKAVEAVSKIAVLPPRIRTEIAELDFDSKKGILTTMRSGKDHAVFEQSLPVPDVLGYISNFTHLKKETIRHIIDEANFYKKIRTNPQFAMDSIVRELRAILHTMMVDGIKYEKIAGEEYEMTLFDSEEIESYVDNMFVVAAQEKTLYDYVAYDSDVEHDFVKELEARDEVKFYMKLPSWFVVNTPLGTYNPDWAVVFEGDKRLYLVAETKGTSRIDDLKPAEALKIKSGEKHFAALDGVSFVAPVKTLRDMTDKLAA